jgi:hypothetical protein
MSAAETTLPSSSGSSNPSSTTLRKALDYTPGSQVVPTRPAKRRRKEASSGYYGLPTEVLDKILEYMVTSRAPLSVVKLSMVNREFRQGVAANVDVWYKLYLFWRGIPRNASAQVRTSRGLLTLRPTYPMSLPNFQIRPPPVTLLLSLDKQPVPEHERRRIVAVYRKIVMLQCLPCCGMCGTRRHRTKPFWCLGMRICRQCVVTNMISSMALFERFWITFNTPVHGYRSFVDAIQLSVFYFQTRLTPNQRLEFSQDKIDFPGGMRTIWFFWRPHLDRVLNMERLEQEGKEKHAAASVVRGFARRCLILRAVTSTKDRKARVSLPHGVFAKRDLRTVEHRLRKIELLDSVDQCLQQHLTARLTPEQHSRLVRNEDRVLPFMFN